MFYFISLNTIFLKNMSKIETIFVYVHTAHNRYINNTCEAPLTNYT